MHREDTRAPAYAPEIASSVLEIDVAAVVANDALGRRAGAAECAGVVKADAYGLGVATIAPALARAGCNTFFVAQVEEGVALRAILGRAGRIAILNGAPPGAELSCRQHDLVPVLNDAVQLEAWRGLAAGHRQYVDA